MLAQLNSKQKSIFFNLKPTVIDKLISKNKCSIQNYTIEDSEESVSSDSEESSSSSLESTGNTLISEHQSASMAPTRRNNKVSVLATKLASKSQFPKKRNPGRPPISKVVKQGSSLKIMAAKKLLENSKKGATKEVTQDMRNVKRKRKTDNNPHCENEKRPRSKLKNKNFPSTLDSSEGKKRAGSKETTKAALLKKNPRLVKESSNIVTVKRPPKTPASSQTSVITLLDTKSSPRKFPSNVVDHWKSTGLAIRGRGRPRGSFRGLVRGSLRGGLGIGRVALRVERYNTRDSQKSGLMRSGKQRKCSDSNLVEGLDRFRRRRKTIKREKNDCPSDEQSSFVTTSELSFCDNEISFKQSDDEAFTSGLTNIKVEKEDDETVQSRDTNSNVFKNSSNVQLKQAIASTSSIDIGNESNISETVFEIKDIKVPKKTWVRGRKKRAIGLIKRKPLLQSDSSLRDSDCSFDSDLADDSITLQKSGNKRQRRKGSDGSWVRRSTRSIGKDDKVESDDVIQELLKEKDFAANIESNSKGSLKVDSEQNHDSFDILNDDNTLSNKLTTQEHGSNQRLDETPLKKCKIVEDSFLLTDVTFTSTPDSVKNTSELSTYGNTSYNNNLITSNENDFTLTLEETPVKNESVEPAQKNHTEIFQNLKFDMSNESFTEKSKDIEGTYESTVQSSSLNHRPLLISENEPEVEQLSRDDKNKEEILKINSEKNSGDSCGGSLFQKNIEEETNINIVDVKTTSKVETFDHEKSSNNGGTKTSLSDEKIISLIDSFCQSHSIDSAINGGEKCSEAVKEGDKLNSKSAQETLGQETKPSVEQLRLNDPKTTIRSDPIEDQPIFSNKILGVTDFQSDVSTKSKERCKESDPNCEFSKTDLTTLTSEHSLNKFNIQEEDASDDKMKMEVDIKNVDKAVATESTEESSSSDSNSHLLEFMSSHLDSESVKSTLAVNHSLHTDASEIIKIKTCEVPNKKDQLIDVIKPCLDINSENISSDMTNVDSVFNEPQEENEEVSHSQDKALEKSSAEDTVVERPSKELLSALGLQSTQSAYEEKPKRPVDNYTGTLKAVIKLNRSSDKRSERRKMIFKQGDALEEDEGGSGNHLVYRICSAEEPSTENVPLTHLADIPANRKAPQLKVKSQFDLSNSPNIVGTSSCGDNSADSTKEGGKQNLVIPEKSSSFSIHPERLCTDVCAYCMGKFGSLDTPCHLAQLKNAERQAKILDIEKHLSTDSCLCDGCFRYVDRKANCPASQRSRKPAARRGPLAGTICAVQDCSQQARHSVRRKWLIKLKKSIGKKLVIDMDKNPQLPVPLCSQHYYWVDYFTVCGICKKRLTRNHMYALGPEAEELNKALSDDGIPVRLSDKLFLCKLCRYYSNLRLRYQGPSTISSTHYVFLSQYRKKILRYYDIPVSDSEEEGKSIEEESVSLEETKSKKKKSKSKSFDDNEHKTKDTDKIGKHDSVTDDQSNESQMIDYSFLDTLNVHRDEQRSPTMDYSDLGDINSQVGFSNIASLLNPLEGGKGAMYPPDSQNRSRAEKPTRIQVKFGNLNIGKLSNLNIGQDSRPATSTTPTAERPPFLPGERDLNLSGDYEFHGPLNPTSGWERCTYNVQFDRDTKKLWQDLQRPYGNQSSFLRHLVILEKYWRNGSLTFSENPNPKAVKYFNSVRNRVQAYDGSKSTELTTEKPKQIEVTIENPPRPMSTPVKVTSAPPPLMKIAPGTVCWRPNQMKKPPPYSFPVSSTQTSATYSSPLPTPPPYRLPTSRPGTSSVPVFNQVGSVRLPIFSSTAATVSQFYPGCSAQSIKNQQNPRPKSISYQQFKKIRIEQPPSTVSKVMVTPKVEARVETQTSASATTSSSGDFAPMICDVRSLASSSSDWTESFRKQQQKLLKQNVAKYYTPILPKIPNSLTVTTFPTSPGLVMKTSSLTIEKAPSDSTKPTIVPPEKPSISVFREPTTSEHS